MIVTLIITVMYISLFVTQYRSLRKENFNTAEKILIITLLPLGIVFNLVKQISRSNSSITKNLSQHAHRFVNRVVILVDEVARKTENVNLKILTEKNTRLIINISNMTNELIANPHRIVVKYFNYLERIIRWGQNSLAYVWRTALIALHNINVAFRKFRGLRRKTICLGNSIIHGLLHKENNFARLICSCNSSLIHCARFGLWLGRHLVGFVIFWTSVLLEVVVSFVTYERWKELMYATVLEVKYILLGLCWFISVPFRIVVHIIRNLLWIGARLSYEHRVRTQKPIEQ
jgi:hypothetical protein